MGGLGLRVARWLVDRGARNLVLVGRRDPSTSAHHDIAELQRTANVAIAQADVARQDEMARLFDEVREALPPLRGIVHAAGVLDNGLLTHQSLERFNHVAAPKIDGAWNLHVLSRETPLDFFVMFSSATSLLGSPGQGNYAAANAFLDTLAHYRAAHNLLASSINWGPWAEIGMAAAAGDRERARFEGITAIQPEQGVRMLGEVLRRGASQTLALIVDWPRFLDRIAAGQEPSVLSELAPAPEARRSSRKPSQRPGDLKRQVEAAPRNQRHDVLLSSLHDQVMTAMGLEAVRSIDVRRPLAELGMDSLTAVELRNILAAGVGCSLPASLLFDYPSIEALAKYLAREVFAWDDTTESAFAPHTAARTEKGPLGSRYDDLSDEELAARLAEKLAHRAERLAAMKSAG
jgi:NAD(P)-dependent dehydrogenase (short-subunit alcohol dehydrogenase family)/acyl carrier protein